jgi:CspA family cold shock protein
MPVGTVKFFDVGKGFGFIIPDGRDKEIFVHISAVERSGMGTLREGQRVQYDTEISRRTGKIYATKLRPA